MYSIVTRVNVSSIVLMDSGRRLFVKYFYKSNKNVKTIHVMKSNDRATESRLPAI